MRGIKNNDNVSVRQVKNFNFNKKSSRWRQVTAGLVIAFVALACIGSAYIVDDGTGGVYDSDYGNVFISQNDYDYLVTNHSNVYYVINGSNGKVVYSNSTDVSGAINYCISNPVAAKGVHIVMASGSYDVISGIDFTDHPETGANEYVILEGQGKGFDNYFTRLVSKGCTGDMITIAGTFSEVKNMWIDGNEFECNHGISGSSFDIILSDLTITRTGGDGVNIDNSKHGVFEKLWIEYTAGDGFEIDAGTNQGMDRFTNCHITCCYSNGLYISGQGTHMGGIIIGCNFQQNNKYNKSYYAGLKIEDSNYWTVDANCFEGNYQNDIYINSSSLNVKYITIDANVFSDYAYGGSYHTEHFINMTGGTGTVSNCILSDNSFYASNSEEIRMDSKTNDNHISNVKEYVEITDLGQRNVINGLGYNAGVPGSAGDWQTWGDVDGVFVLDTINDDLYIYAESAWHNITIS